MATLGSCQAACLSTTQTGQVFGWALADQPSVASYTPAAATQWNSKGGTNTVLRTGTGAYLVSFPGLGNVHGGSVQLSAYGDDAARCKVASWTGPPLAGVLVNVSCFQDGAPVDSGFVVAYGASNPADADSGYALYSPPATPLGPSVATDPTRSSNISSVYTPTGLVMLPTSLPRRREHLTAVGTGPEYCILDDAGSSCYDATGTALDRSFDYVVGFGLPSSLGLNGAWATFDVPWNWVTTHTPSVQAMTWSSPSAISVERTAQGRYRVRLPDGAPYLSASSMVMVTAYDIQHSGIPAHCKLVGWGPEISTTNVVIDVACFWQKAGAVGTPADHGFHVTFLATAPPGVVTHAKSQP